MKIAKYEHHGVEVSVRDDLKGRHREFCLCHMCKRFNPGVASNCRIAQATFKNCVEFNTTTPMWECPEFSLQETENDKEEKEAGGKVSRA